MSSSAASSASSQKVSSLLSRMTIHDDILQPPVALLLERTERQYQELQKRDEIIARFCQTTNSAEEGQLAEIKLQTLRLMTELAREKNTVNDTLQKLRQQLALQAQSQSSPQARVLYAPTITHSYNDANPSIGWPESLLPQVPKDQMKKCLESLVKCQNALKNVLLLVFQTGEQERYQLICKFVNNRIKHAGHCGLKAIAVKNSTHKRPDIVIIKIDRVRWKPIFWKDVFYVLEVKNTTMTNRERRNGKKAIGQVIDRASQAFTYQPTRTLFYGLITDGWEWHLVTVQKNNYINPWLSIEDENGNEDDKDNDKEQREQKDKQKQEEDIRKTNARHLIKKATRKIKAKRKKEKEKEKKQKAKSSMPSALHFPHGIPSLKAAAEIKEQNHPLQEDSLFHHYYHTPDDLPFDLTKVFCERMKGASVFEAKMKNNGKMIVAKFEPSSSEKSQACAESQVLELLSTTLKEEPCFFPKWEGFIQVGFMDVLCTSPVGQGTLADLLSTKGKGGLAASTLFLLASNVSKALQQLHSCNLVMRDLHE
ncbi:hypothetical protein QOT17_020575, partial [Balamuthia mandrillaris]